MDKAKKQKPRKERKLLANIDRMQSRRLHIHWNTLYPTPRTWFVVEEMMDGF